MSHDLDFWRYKDNTNQEHQKTYEALSDGETLDTVEELPIEKMKQRVADLFSKGWERLDEMTWEAESDERGSFQLFTTPQFFRVDCYGMEGEDMNHFIDIGLEFDCPLYDPQEEQRFGG
jgi:hypothetical protein